MQLSYAAFSTHLVYVLHNSKHAACLAANSKLVCAPEPGWNIWIAAVQGHQDQHHVSGKCKLG